PRLRTIEPDKKTFRKMKESLRAFATGNYTLTSFADKMFSLGLVGARNGNKLHLSSIEHILTNPFYYGHFRYRGEVHQGSHKPMISKKLFDKIQIALKDNGKPRKKQKDKKEFLFLNFAKCGECGYCITADRKIKKSGREYVYYFCTKKSKKQKCNQNIFLREELFAEQVKEFCQKVSLPDVWRDKYLAKVEEWNEENKQTTGLFVQNLKLELEKVKMKMSRLTDAYLDEIFELSEFQQKKNALMARKKKIEEKLSDFERKGNHWLELVRNWILEANQAKNLALSDNFSEMKNFLKKIGSNPLIAEQKLAIEFQKPWNYLLKMPLSAFNADQSTARRAANSEMWT
ncbi:MAG: recombinase family protein, partial [Candidatus Paceibacterota bacterium]